jgi:integrase
MPDFYLLPDEINIPSPRYDRKLLGQKPPLKPRDVWAIRIRLQIQGHKRDLAFFNLAIDSKLRSCDLVALRVRDICKAERAKDLAVIIQKKTHRPVQFELTEQARQAAQAWIAEPGLRDEDYVFPSRVGGCAHLSTRQYARIVDRWVISICLDPHKYGTYSMRRTKAALIYKKTVNLRAVQLLLGHTMLEITVRYLGIELTMPCKFSSRWSYKPLAEAVSVRTVSATPWSRECPLSRERTFIGDFCRL